MIDMSDTLEWLNHFDRSHLNGINQRLFATARNRRMDNAAIQDLLRAALQQARTSPQDALDYAETLLNCGEIEYSRGLLEPARDHFATAVGNYVRGKDVHGAAVASWMLGIAELALVNTDAVYRNWKRAINTFGKFRNTNRHIHDTREWYTETFIKMNKDLVILPQESFSWLTQFDGSCISPTNRDLINILDRNIQNGNPNEANRIINVLKERAKTSSDPSEAAEIFAETGLARFKMRDWMLAVKDLKLAFINYPSESHHQESARWLLGAVQFWVENQRVEATVNWEKSMDGFRRLARQADQNNLGPRKRWYKDRILYMAGALRGKVNEAWSDAAPNSPPPQNDGNPPGTPQTPQSPAMGTGPSQPGPSKSQATQTDRYQYLVLLVQGDLATADRLIEFERTKAPTSDRSELIERAIERLLRQRQ